jgi:thymidylate synthase
MNYLDRDYQYLLDCILSKGIEKKDRTGTGTKSLFGYQIRHNMKDGFPLLTTKKMAWKSIVTELLWFLRGDTNIKYLVDNGCHIWDGDAYKNYVNKCNEDKWMKEIILDLPFPNKSYGLYSQEEFINKIKTDDEFAEKWGDLGPIYGKQWRNWETKEKIDFKILNNSDSLKIGQSSLYTPPTIDQIANLISELKTNPDSRRLMVNAWNVGELSEMVLPPCHYGFQVYTRELSESELWDYIHKNKIEILHQHAVLYGHEVGSEYRKSFIPTLKENYNIPTRAISLMWNQRSVDVGLGLGFNIASYGLLLEIIAKEVNMVPDELIGNLGDTHLYLDHVEPIKEQIGREPFELPKLGKLPDYLGKKDNWECYKPEDFILENYQSHPTIKLPLSN